MEFDRITARGGVLGAMETGYQRSRIQEESIYYERLKHTGEHPIVGVNTFLNPDGSSAEAVADVELARATPEEIQSQLDRLADFQKRHQGESEEVLRQLKETVLAGENIFAELMNTVRCCSMGQITRALYAVGGRYRRGM